MFENTKGAKIARGEKVAQTNYERITSLTIDELAHYLCFFDFGDKFCKGTEECSKLLDAEKEIPERMCIACARRWLEAEVTE